MKPLHADDLSIQQYAFDSAECDPQVAYHITACGACLAKVEAYTTLATSVKALPEPILDYNLSNLVIRQIQVQTEADSKRSYLYAVVALVAISFFALALFLFNSTVSYLLDGAPANQIYFIISVTVFATAILVFDQFRTFNARLKTLTT